MTHVVAYRRVSSHSQSLDRQDFAGCELDKCFEDHVSGSTSERPGLQDCLAYLRDGDRLLVHSIDRLARSNQDLQTIVGKLMEKRVTVEFLKEGLCFDGSPQADLILTVMGAMATFERSLIRERQREGIEKAKAKGKYRKAQVPIDLTEVKARLKQGVSMSRIARDLNVSRTTVYARLKEHELASA